MGARFKSAARSGASCARRKRALCIVYKEVYPMYMGREGYWATARFQPLPPRDAPAIQVTHITKGLQCPIPVGQVGGGLAGN